MKKQNTSAKSKSNTALVPTKTAKSKDLQTVELRFTPLEYGELEKAIKDGGSVETLVNELIQGFIGHTAMSNHTHPVKQRATAEAEELGFETIVSRDCNDVEEIAIAKDNRIFLVRDQLNNQEITLAQSVSYYRGVLMFSDGCSHGDGFYRWMGRVETALCEVKPTAA